MRIPVFWVLDAVEWSLGFLVVKAVPLTTATNKIKPVEFTRERKRAPHAEWALCMWRLEEGIEQPAATHYLEQTRPSEI